MLSLDEIKKAAAEVPFDINWEEMHDHDIEAARQTLKRTQEIRQIATVAFSVIASGKSTMSYADQERSRAELEHAIFQSFVAENIATTVLAVADATK